MDSNIQFVRTHGETPLLICFRNKKNQSLHNSLVHRKSSFRKHIERESKSQEHA